MSERKFFDIYLSPIDPQKERGVYINQREKEWKPETDIHIERILITISTWEKIPVKVGVCLNGKGVDAGADDSDKVLACLTTPASGGGSSTVVVEVDADIEAESLINIYVWAHNMQLHPNDLHAQVIIYYKFN